MGPLPAAPAAASALCLAGGVPPLAMAAVLWRRDGEIGEAIVPFERFHAWARAEGGAVRERVKGLLAAMAAPRPPFAGLVLDRPRLMGVVNVTPDSFSDGGRHVEAPAAVAHGLALLEAGADIVDVGGESTRPGAASVDPDEERRRVVPVIRALAERGARVSVDTRRASVMAAAAAAGAVIINDVTALAGDAGSLGAAARSGLAVVLMHMQGEPATMQADPRYDHAALDVCDALERRLAACRAAGIGDERLCVDPGIGFGKTDAHNMAILARLSLFRGLGVAVALGASRKSFIARLSRGEPADDRLAGSLVAAVAAAEGGAHILRVHDVAATAQALAVWRGWRGLEGA